jgi:hypothetical protein
MPPLQQQQGGADLMPRIRTIKPDFFKSEDVSALPMRARLTWIGLWTQCDDHGRTKDNVKLIKGDLWALEDVSLRDIEEDLTVLEAHGRIVRYSAGGVRYLAVVNWHQHQAINRMSAAKHPAPPVVVWPTNPKTAGYCEECATSRPAPAEHYASEPRGIQVPAPLSEPSVSPHGGLTPGREGKGREGKGDAGARGEHISRPHGPGPEPPPRCPKHVDDDNPPACGACGDARRTLETWRKASAAAALEQRSAEARARADAKAAEIAACRLCDDAGYLGGAVCYHDASVPDRATRGAALARANIRSPTRPKPDDRDALAELTAAVAELQPPQELEEPAR